MRRSWPANRLPLPTLCEGCRSWSDEAVCAGCCERFGPVVARCDGCTLRLAPGALRCGECLREALPFARCRCAVDDGFPWDGLVAAFKHGGRAELATPLARRLGAALTAENSAWPDLVLPVPLAPVRLADRGYKQAWELARRIGADAERPGDAMVVAREPGRSPQAGLARAARRRNLRGAFRVARPERVAGRRIALVDDVLTTGATAAEATQALLAAGAAEVAAWALARTP